MMAQESLSALHGKARATHHLLELQKKSPKKLSTSQLLDHTDKLQSEGTFVTVHGYLRHFNKKQTIAIYDVRKITDFNEVTYHFLECIKTHYYLNKGSLSREVLQKKKAAVKQQAQEQGAQTDEELAGIIYNAINELAANAQNTGITTDELLAHLQGAVDEDFVRTSVHSWITEGHLFTTSDDQHFLPMQQQ